MTRGPAQDPADQLAKEINLGDRNSIVLFTDQSCEMAKVVVNGVALHEGNDWDFHAGCCGQRWWVMLDRKFGESNRPEGLVKQLESFIEARGKSVSTTTKSYKYE